METNKDRKLTIEEMQKVFDKHKTGWALGQREYDAINEILYIALLSSPSVSESKIPITEDLKVRAFAGCNTKMSPHQNYYLGLMYMRDLWLSSLQNQTKMPSDEKEKLIQALHGIYNLCDPDNPTHEHIWHVANDVLHGLSSLHTEGKEAVSAPGKVEDTIKKEMNCNKCLDSGWVDGLEVPCRYCNPEGSWRNASGEPRGKVEDKKGQGND